MPLPKGCAIVHYVACNIALHKGLGMDSTKNPKHLTLSEALKTGQLQEFIEQREADGIGPAN